MISAHDFGHRRWDVFTTLVSHFRSSQAPMDTVLGVEVGTRTGVFAKRVLRMNPELELLVVDPYETVETREQDPLLKQVEGSAEAARNMVDNLFEFRPRVHFLLTTSERAARIVADESVGLVFVDGAHNRGSVEQDIALWWKKLHRGGFLSGHDYTFWHGGVVEAVDAFCRNSSKLLHLGPGGMWWVKKDFE